MWSRRWLALPVLAAATALAFAVRAQADDWQTVVGPDLRFRLEMPSPADKSTAETREKGHAAPRLAWESKRGGQIFDFDYVDYLAGWFSERDSKVMAKELGRGAVETAFPLSKYKYAKDEPVTLQGWDGYALDIESEDGGLVMMRTFIVRDRLYRLLVTAQADMRSRSAAVRFLDSLRLAETRD